MQISCLLKERCRPTSTEQLAENSPRLSSCYVACRRIPSVRSCSRKHDSATCVVRKHVARPWGGERNPLSSDPGRRSAFNKKVGSRQVIHGLTCAVLTGRSKHQTKLSCENLTTLELHFVLSFGRSSFNVLAECRISYTCATTSQGSAVVKPISARYARLRSNCR